jgi:hypothetical protein
MRVPIYEYLDQLNRNLQETVEVLERIRKLPRLFTREDKKKFHAYQVEIEFLRAEASQDIAEIMDAVESKEAHRFWMRKKAYEESIGDPDDIYFEVIRREEELRKQGLPQRLETLRQQFAKGWREDQQEQEKDREEKGKEAGENGNPKSARARASRQNKGKTNKRKSKTKR